MELLLPMKLFLAKGWIFERAFPGRKSATVASMQQSLLVQKFQVFTNGDLRCFESLGEIGHQDPTLAVYQFYNRASAFFVQHKFPFILEYGLVPGVVIPISLYSV